MRVTIVGGLLGVFLSVFAAHADPLTISMKDVENGLAGNAGVFAISEFEITNAEFVVFLNAIAETDAHNIYHTDMASDPHGGISRTGDSGEYVYTVKPIFGNKPVNYVRWTDAIRFVNWLHNGQPTGAQSASTTEDGAYELFETEVESHFDTERSAAARWVLPDSYEWKKAARYDPTKNGGAGGFWTFATRSNTAPASSAADSNGDLSDPNDNVVNYKKNSDWNGSTDGNVTTVGSAGSTSASYYGTSDQNGNVAEWTEDRNWVYPDYCARMAYGGSFYSPGGGTPNQLTLALGVLIYDTAEGIPRGPKTGFRVVRLCPPVQPGDVQGDGDVDNVDLAILLSNYAMSSGAGVHHGDVDCDGDVDLSDLALLLAHYGESL